jgi:hypothetical protein
MENQDVTQPITKVVSAWALAGISMDQIAYTLSAIYTLCLLGEWIYKKVRARTRMKSNHADDAA